MSAILDVGQPFSEASIELCNIFNAALNEIDYEASLKLVPNEDYNETRGWLLGDKVGLAGEVVYHNGAIQLHFFKVSPWPVALLPWYDISINLGEPNSLQKLGRCLKRFTAGSN